MAESVERSLTQRRYDVLGPRVVKRLEARGYAVWYVADAAAAREKALALLAGSSSVSWGGSVTLEEIGLLDVVRRMPEEGVATRVLDRDTADDADGRAAIQRAALTADTFLMSFNGVSEDGLVVNIDGFGNRLAALLYGPRQVIAVVGMNKVAADIDATLSRARCVAAPANALRLELDTGCTQAGSCVDCALPSSICSYFVVNRRCKPAQRIKVVLVGEDLGL